MVRIGIVGIGFMGMIHYLGARKARGAQVTALCSRDAKKLGGDWRGAGRSEREHRAENDEDLLEHLLFPHPMVNSADALLAPPPAFYSGRIPTRPLCIGIEG